MSLLKKTSVIVQKIEKVDNRLIQKVVTFNFSFPFPEGGIDGVCHSKRDF